MTAPIVAKVLRCTPPGLPMVPLVFPVQTPPVFFVTLAAKNLTEMMGSQQFSPIPTGSTCVWKIMWDRPCPIGKLGGRLGEIEEIPNC